MRPRSAPAASALLGSLALALPAALRAQPAPLDDATRRAVGIGGLVVLGPEAGGVARAVGPVGILSLLFGSVVLGTASLRAGTLPRGAAWALVAFGLATVPLAFALPTLAGTIPLYWLEETHFLLGVAVWAGVGAALRSPVPAVG